MPSSVPLPTAPARSGANRINDLVRERDRMSANLLATKRLLAAIRDAVFNPTWDNNQSIAAVRQYLVDEWDIATPPGKAFDLMRSHDSSRVSGEGRVAEGFEFENGKAVLCWLGPYSSVNTYDSIDHIRHIHGHGGSTEVVYR